MTSAWRKVVAMYKEVSMVKLALIVFGILMIQGCAQKLGFYSKPSLKSNQAVVLVAVDSTVPIDEAKDCTLICTSFYELGGKKDIYAFVADVGSKFEINHVLIGMSYANFEGKALDIDRSGVYYYGALLSNGYKVAMSFRANDKYLNRGKRKYREMLSGLEPVNFEWPKSNAYVSSYDLSNEIQKSLKKMAGNKLFIDTINCPVSFDSVCRAKGSIALPDSLPYEKFIRSSFERELKAAKLWSAKGLKLSGRVTHLEFSSTSGWWRIGIELMTHKGNIISERIHFPVEVSFSGSRACGSIEDALPLATQKLLAKLVENQKFKDFVIGEY